MKFYLGRTQLNNDRWKDIAKDMPAIDEWKKMKPADVPAFIDKDKILSEDDIIYCDKDQFDNDKYQTFNLAVLTNSETMKNIQTLTVFKIANRIPSIMFTVVRY